jgi:hypothetical protein
MFPLAGFSTRLTGLLNPVKPAMPRVADTTLPLASRVSMTMSLPAEYSVTSIAPCSAPLNVWSWYSMIPSAERWGPKSQL